MVTNTVLVTGAAGGMGAEAVATLARRGANVICVDLDRPALDSLVASLGAWERQLLAVKADVSDEHAMERAIDEGEDRFGAIDGLFNIAGSEGSLAQLHDMRVEDFDAILAINATSVFVSMRLLVPRFIARGGGRIVNTGSYAAVRATRGTSAYGAAKHAVVGLTRAVALEYAPHGVRANVLCPGAMNTRMMRPMFARLGAGDLRAGEEIIRALMPTHDLIEPHELAGTGSWMLLDAPDQFTGQVVMVDGGRYAG